MLRSIVSSRFRTNSRAPSLTMATGHPHHRCTHPLLLPPPQEGPSVSSCHPHRLQQVAWNWQAVIRRRLDRRTGQFKYEDWDAVIRGFQEPSLLDGTTLLHRHLGQERHIKPTEARRRLNSGKVYKRSVKRVEDLVSYIKFIQTKEKKE